MTTNHPQIPEARIVELRNYCATQASQLCRDESVARYMTLVSALDELLRLRAQRPKESETTLRMMREKVHTRMAADADCDDQVHPCDVWSMALRWLDDEIQVAMGYSVTVSGKGPVSAETAAALHEVAQVALKATANADREQSIAAWRESAVSQPVPRSDCLYEVDIDEINEAVRLMRRGCGSEEELT